jgi:hypothetical protein
VILPPRVRPYPLYNEIGQVHGGLGERVYGLHPSESRRALQRCAVDRGSVVEPKNPGALSGCSVLTLCVLGCISLDRRPPGRPSGVFSAVKEVDSRGLRTGPGASESLKAAGKLCLLVSRPVRDLVGKVVGNVVPKGQRRGPPSLGSSRHVFLRPGLG